MYKLNVTSDFSSAHKLDGYEGLCKNLHGHNWKVRIGILCEKVDEIGMTIDYGEVKKSLSEIMMMLDHTYLNELEHFKGINPTSENIAKFIYKEMKKRIEVPYCKMADVEVWESDITSMIYFE
ncbi:MAG: 6-carboxytetrahydropterin synthase QueD [Candidatus Cloacimonetes bacterium]|jgi:6-pyruvoyltetrahydropterin/6-carboxytetrahydropterin synthase|nr:6-carboxytetrahydropterin synthase QueD [Candidatus Cloacimonadota bacterium]MBT4333601.1 6-carboxytetrahydropterin synthase QueD [Candidatus Cloacimonadota bacterium]MBT4576624.1 6-carboxytetrahydropterin synthase QueD [Candidatus Cloacimonadota bacterium]MBT5421299.1 6-carboxytetrahydropterin synthase QueD [Candidatus Cloacimonadota bacterium]